MAQQAAQRLERVISLKYQREEYRLGDDSGMSNLVMPGISYSYLRSDNRIDPHHGYHLQFDSKVAKEGLGSDTNLLYGTAMIKGLTTLWDNHRFLARAQVGGSATNGYKSVPPSLRFFAGGDQSVRGYDYQTLSPENDQGDRIGGRYMVALSAEYQYSIAEKWRIATFIDQGNSFNTLEMPSLKTGVGVGMRWVSPVGPIRLDLAHAWKIRAAFDCTFPWGLSCDAWFENRGAGCRGRSRPGSAGTVDAAWYPGWQPLGLGPGAGLERRELPGASGRWMERRSSVVATGQQSRRTHCAGRRLVAGVPVAHDPVHQPVGRGASQPAISTWHRRQRRADPTAGPETAPVHPVGRRSRR
jgi:hypothetical protein